MTGKPEAMFDKRIIARNIKRERVSRKEYEQYLKSLEDAAPKAVPMFHEDLYGGEEDD